MSVGARQKSWITKVIVLRQGAGGRRQEEIKARRNESAEKGYNNL